MAELNAISAARTGDVDGLERALASGSPLHERDEHGWTPLNWAAGKGHAAVIQVLLQRGADVCLTGRDGRTPLMIARSAGHSEATELLRQAEQGLGVWKDPRAERPYCRAYKVAELLDFPRFSEIAVTNISDTPERIIYLHHDFTVTSSMWHGENVIIRDITADWRDFCEWKLRFEVPADVL